MVPFRAFIRHPVVAGILVLIIFSGATALVSMSQTGSYTQLFFMIPWWAWAIIALTLGLVSAVIIATRRYRARSRRSGTTIFVGRVKVGGSFADYWARVATFTGGFQDVMWQYRGRAIEGIGSETRPDIDPDSIEVESPPLCPKCLTGLQEKAGVLGGHVWRCVGCGWQRRSREDFASVATEAELYFQGRWRRDLHDRGVIRR
jgi:hypothetical protein